MISVHSCPLARLGGQETGGMNVYIQELSRELGRRGIAVDIFTRWTNPSVPSLVGLGPQGRVIHLKAGEVGPLPKNEVLRHLPEFICNMRRFKEEQNIHYDLLHSHYWLSGWVARFLQERWYLPHVTMFHTLGQLKNRARPAENESAQRISIEQKIIASADRIIAATTQEKAAMIDLYGVEPERIRVVPCGVDLRTFQPSEKAVARKQLGLADQRLVLFVGRVEPLKGADILIRAMSHLAGMRGLRLLIIGGDGQQNDPQIGRLRSLVARLGLGEKVSFLGPIEQERLPLYYSAAEVCVVPSHYESFCLVALEALACGTPVIASRVGALPNIIHHNENGLLVTQRSPSGFAEAVRSLLDGPVRWGRLAQAARPSVEHLTWSAVADQIMQVYNELIMGAPKDLALCTDDAEKQRYGGFCCQC